MNSTTYHTPISTVDVMLFTLRPTGLHVLLIPGPNQKNEPFPGQLALPGGFVHLQEDRTLDDTARRVLAQKAGVSHRIYLEQLQTFSGMTRDPCGWSISQAYWALGPSDVADQIVTNAKWVGGWTKPLAWVWLLTMPKFFKKPQSGSATRPIILCCQHSFFPHCSV